MHGVQKCSFNMNGIIFHPQTAQTVQTKFDAMTMHENPKAAAQANMPDDGTGTKKVGVHFHDNTLNGPVCTQVVW